MEKVRTIGFFVGVSLLDIILFRIPFWGTFIYLMFYDGYVYNSWNWILAILFNTMLSAIWPIYWILHFIGFAS